MVYTATVRNFLRVQLPPDKAIKIFRFIQDDKAGLGSVDFNKIDPLPPWVFQGNLDPAAERKYGPENCWLQWCKSHWGCARNALNPNDSAAMYDYGDAIVFETDERDVRVLIRKLSLIFKHPQFDYMWADEDIGLNCGMLGYRDGVEDYAVLPEPHSRRAYELAFDVFGTRPEEYGMVYDPQCNNYVYRGGSLAKNASIKMDPVERGLPKNPQRQTVERAVYAAAETSDYEVSAAAHKNMNLEDEGDMKAWQSFRQHSDSGPAEEFSERQGSQKAIARKKAEAALQLEPLLNQPPPQLPSTGETS